MQAIKTRSHRRALLGVAVAAAAGLGMVPAGAQAATLTATPSNLSSIFASAQGGDTITLAGGGYGTFTGGSKASPVTVKPQSGATVTMGINFNGANNVRVEGVTITSAQLQGTTKNVTIAGSRFTGSTVIRTVQMANANIVLDGNTHNNISPNGGYEGRITLPSRNENAASGVTIKNSLFSGGLSDGIQNGSNGTQILSNEFVNIRQGDPNIAHTDALQLYGSKNTVIRGNYFHNVEDGIMAPDGTDHEVIENNVFVTAGSQYSVTLGSDNGSVVRHNTMLRTGLRLQQKSGLPTPKGTVVKDNILAGYTREAGTVDESYNLFTSGSGTGANDLRGTPAFVGGSAPATYAGYALASGSPGKANASDGKDRGAIVTGAAPAPAPTNPTPANPAPADKPAVATWTAPTGVRVGQAVTLDGTRSTGDGTLKYTWSFENADGSTVWETRTGARVAMTFSVADTKYVKLTVTDADGDRSSSRKSFVVTR
jgi:hypothetical protein